ncbi:unnamed protein product [Brassica oleracea]
MGITFSLSANNMILIVYMFSYNCSIKLYSGLKPQSASFLTNGHQNLNRSSVAGSTRVCNPGISQCSSFGIGLPFNVLGSLSLWFGQRFAMPLLRIALQSPAGAARGQLIFKDLSRLKMFNSEEAIEYGLIIVRPPRIKDDAPFQDET